ncbi:prepilin-type N-terminal cleavage/methylation domain-containing protein [Diaphorobacter sp. HDW4B]|uniref:prepilin-type N-terminal cleavage/methylation domain-containing protein n=1 Tax=Diaphorobacter sp. HDW4B TaxID=2714925 RepID=UPI001408327D|nr:prepilin-type N-terminal cleavage/methylation domain-containing protein [Diaphorobacter sp. HDW4B]QIL70124.1 prepilin-type N-terminal cleavage/methylation domain-containing protein [Diaphorobacter sp. HDW4B]
MTRAHRGFTLLELLVVLSIVALATVGVSFAMRDNGATELQREGERLAVLLETARAQSRASGTAVRWRTTEQGFLFEGLPNLKLPERWLTNGTRTSGPSQLWLGPEPIISAQQVWVVNDAVPGRAIRVGTDGVRAFTVESMQ